MRVRSAASVFILLAFCLIFGLAAGSGFGTMGELVAAMGRHNVLPIDAMPLFARLVVGAEGAASVMCGVSIVWPPARPWAALGVCALTTSFVIYLAVVALGPEPYVPCGCAIGRELPVPAALARAAGLLGLAILCVGLCVPCPRLNSRIG